MIIKDDQLCDAGGTPVTFTPTPNQGRNGQDVTIAPSLLVMHFTAGGSLGGAVSWFTNPQAQASAHIVVERDGSIVQCVRFNRRAWHAGGGTWRGRSDINSWSVGIELVNWGKLKRAGQKWITWPGAEYRGHTVHPDTDVIEAPHRNAPNEGALGWPPFTEPQMDAAIAAATAIIKHYGITEVIGHEDFRADKTDPGPAFPLSSFRARVLGRDEGAEFMVTTDSVNIRTAAGIQNATTPDSPLPKGQLVSVKDSSGDWRFVTAKVSGKDATGWVHGNYLAPAA